MPNRYREHPYVPSRDPLGAIPPSRHPFQFWVMFALVISGAANFFAPGSEVLQHGLDPAIHKTWAATLMIGAIVTLLAAFWGDRITGLLMERIGLAAIGLSCPIYSLVVAMSNVGAFATSAVVMASVGIASIWRLVHVNRELKKLRLFVARHFR